MATPRRISALPPALVTIPITETQDQRRERESEVMKHMAEHLDADGAGDSNDNIPF